MQDYKSEDWDIFFDNIKNVRQSYIDSYKKYSSFLLENNLPVIFEINHFSQLVGLTVEALRFMGCSPNSYYYNFTIPKRNGDNRNISSPYPSLLHCQKWINNNILKNIKVSDNTHGFLSGKSIITSAREHLNSDCLLKIDLKDFFPSIRKHNVYRVFLKAGYAPNLSNLFTNLCCLDGCLPQGAATSPMLSNIISYKLDARLSGYAKSVNLNYTRYADDLNFSGEYISLENLKFIKNIIETCRFDVNPKKTRLIRGKNKKKIVTGISISSGELKLPRETKRNLRQELHILFKKIDNNSFINNKLFYFESLLGKVNFWLAIEPDNSYAIEYKDKLKKLIKD